MTPVSVAESPAPAPEPAGSGAPGPKRLRRRRDVSVARGGSPERGVRLARAVSRVARGTARRVPVSGGERPVSGSEGALLRLRLGEWIILLVVVRAAPLAAVAAADGPPVGSADVASAARVSLKSSLRLRSSRRSAVRVVSSKRSPSLETVAALV